MPRPALWLACTSVCTAPAAQADETTLTPFVAEFRMPQNDRSIDTIAWRDGDDIRVPREALAALGIAAPADPTLLSAIAGLTWREAPEEAAIIIACAASCFAVQTLNAPEPRTPITPSETGAFLNLDLAASSIAGRTDYGGAFELGIFAPLGAGATTFVLRDGESPLRLDSRWTFDLQDERMRVLAGDGLTRAGATGAPVRFGGLQIARDFTLDPGFIPFPLPTFAGAAQAPSVVDIYVDGALRLRERIGAGPFSIPDAPVLVGAGDAQIVVTDALGRETVISAPFYASASLLRPGLSDFSFTLGAERDLYALESNAYGRAFASGFYRQGLADWLTGEVRADIADAFVNAGAAASLLSRPFGQLDLGFAVSRENGRDGALASIGWRRIAHDISFGVELERASSDFARLGESDLIPARQTSRAYLAFDTGIGQLSLAAAERDARDADAVRTLGLSFAPPTRFGAWSLNAFHVDGSGEDYFSIGVGFAVALGDNASLGAGVEADDADASFRVSAQRPAPSEGGFGWRARAQTGVRTRADLGALYRGGAGEGDLSVSHAAGETGLRAQYAAGLVVLDGEVYAGRPVRESFALVDAGAPEVGVLRENRLVARTGANGRAMITGLRAYEANRIGIVIDDLPLGAVIDADQTIVAPASRAGVRVRFALHIGAGEARVIDARGAPLPPGAILVRVTDGARFPVGGEGRVYLSGMNGPEDFTLDGANACRVRVAVQNPIPAVCS